MSVHEAGREVIVDARWIAAHLGAGVQLVEVDVSPATYDGGHIPGAVLWNAYSDLRDRDYRPVEQGMLEGLLARSGISPETTVVVYGYGGALGFWLLKAHGHADVRMLEGSRDRWAKAGGKWSVEVPAPVPSPRSNAVADASILASREVVEAAIGDPRQVLVDVRSELEYSGQRFWPSGATEDTGRAGHIPGAVSIPIDLIRAENETLKGASELRRTFERAGVTPDKTAIVYCTIGNRASQAWFALRYLLDYPAVRVYYGSWVEWGRAAGAPIEP